MFSRTAKGEANPPPPPPPQSRCHWRWDGLSAADGHALSVEFGASIAVLSAAAETAMFREVFGSGPVSPAAIVAHFDAPLRSAAGALAATHPAEGALADDLRPAWLATLRETATKTAFACGVEVQAPYTIDVSSPSLLAARSEQLQRAAAERRSADRLQQLKQAGELLAQWEQLRRTAPSASPGELLKQVPAESRAEVLRTLLLADADRSTPVPLWCVAGPNLVKIEGDTATAVPLDASAIGPLRSVSPTASGLLLGGQRGVATVPSSTAFLDPGLQSEHGFTRAVRSGNTLYAVHREGGLVRWSLGLSPPEHVWRPAELGGVPRHLTLVGDDLLFAVDGRVLRLHGDELHEVIRTPSLVAALLLTGDRLVIVGTRGAVAVHDARRFTALHSFDAGTGDVAGAALLPWVGSARLLVAGCEGPLVGLGLDDDVVTRYTGSHAGYRTVAACGSAIAGLSPDRQRVVLWNASDGRRPIAEVHVAAATRHRVADFCFAAAPNL